MFRRLLFEEHGWSRAWASLAIAVCFSAGVATYHHVAGSSSVCPSPTANAPDGSDAFGGCYPGPETTGPDAAPDWPGSFTDQGETGCTLPIQSNTTYNFCDFDAGLAIGSSGSPLSNVTFHGCRFKGVSVEDANIVVFGADGGTGITFEYVEVAPGSASPPTPYNQSYQYGIVADGSFNSFAGKLTVRYSDIWGFGNAIAVEGSTQSNPHTFTDNYIHDAANDGGSYHTDGIGDLSGSGVGSYVVINHNTIISAGNTNGIAFQEGVYDHFTVTKNLFSGFGYTVAIWAQNGSTNIEFTDNLYSTILLPDAGPLYPQDFFDTTGSTWRRNKWEVPAGAAWGKTEHDGMFWMPVNDLVVGTDDTQYVSATDYTG